MSGLHFHPLRVHAVQRDGDGAVIVTFDVPATESDTFRFAPGQYLTLRRVVNGEDLRRSYSICAARGEALRVGVRRVPGGAFSGWLHDQLRPGEVLDVMEPQGRFGAALSRGGGAEGSTRHVLLVAGGSGITPVLSIAKTLLESEPGARVTLLYGNRSAASTMFKEELEDLKNRHLQRLAVHHVFSREQADAPLGVTRLDRDGLKRFLTTLIEPSRIDEAFICGPHAMNDEAEAALREAGVPPQRIHIERFGVPPAERETAHVHAAQAGDAAQARIGLVRDGVRREFDFHAGDPSLLDAAARAGLDVPYSCRSGVCATCRAKLIEGRVRMDRNFALEADEVAAGFVLTCQSHPLTPSVVVSFDER